MLEEDLTRRIIGGAIKVHQHWGPGLYEEIYERSLAHDEIWRALDEMYTPRIRHAHLCLWFVADGLPTPLERFLWVTEWMEKHGKLKWTKKYCCA